jgi:hypothetical protein
MSSWPNSITTITIIITTITMAGAALGPFWSCRTAVTTTIITTTTITAIIEVARHRMTGKQGPTALFFLGLFYESARIYSCPKRYQS